MCLAFKAPLCFFQVFATTIIWTGLPHRNSCFSHLPHLSSVVFLAPARPARLQALDDDDDDGRRYRRRYRRRDDDDGFEIRIGGDRGNYGGMGGAYPYGYGGAQRYCPNLSSSFALVLGHSSWHIFRL